MLTEGLTLPDKRKLATIRVRLDPESRELTSKAADDLQRRYDLLFLHLETPKPLRLTSIVRWGISNSKVSAHAWKSPVPTQVIEDYLTDKPDDPPASPITEKDWVQVVKKFISICDHLDKTIEPEPGLFSFGDNPLAHSRGSSRASSLSEGHVSPEDDGPSKKVVCYDDPSRASSFSEGRVSPEDDGSSIYYDFSNANSLPEGPVSPEDDGSSIYYYDSSNTSSLSVGYVSPEDGGPNKKVVYYDG